MMRGMRILAALLLLPACALPDYDFDGDGWSAEAGDCDDYDPTIHGDAEELVHDGIDQDCDDSDTVMRAVGRAHTCDLDAAGRISCDALADVSFGQLNVPEPHTGRFQQIAAGDFHTCALDEGGFVTCWGDDTFGQSSPPTNGIFVSIDAVGNVSLGGRTDRPAICWGDCVSAQRN